MKKSFLIYFILIFSINSLNANENVVLQLKWFHQFQFAGYYAAKEKGFYEELGLDVEIKERDIKFNNIEEVIKGKAQYGIADSILILYKIKQEPVVIISPIFQHSSNIFISLKKNDISSIYDLNNKNMLFYPNDTDGFSLLAMLKKFDVNANLIRKREKNDYIKLINEEVDSMPAYISNEPFLLKEKGYDVNIINPSHYGFDIYGDMLFTNNDEVENHPQRVKKFREATLKGWEYALKHKEEIIQLIHEKYSKDKSIEHLRYEANAIESLISKDLIPLGYIDKGRIQYISEMYKEYGLTNSKINLNDFLFDDLVKKNTKVLLTKEEQQYLKENPILRIHNLDSFPPYNFNVNNYPKGFVIDYMQLIAKQLNIQVEFIVNKTWKESFEMLKAGEIDIIPNIIINEDRKKFIDFSNFSLFSYQVSLGVNKNSNIKSLNDLEGKKLSILENSFLENILRKEYPNIELYVSKTIFEAVEAVSSGKVDAVIGNLSTIEYFINKNWLTNIKTLVVNDTKIQKNVPMYFGFKKENLLLKSILEKANETLSEKEIRELVQIWFNDDFLKDIKLTQIEYNYLSDKKNINYCVNSDLMPIEKFYNDKFTGINSDYINIFKEKLNINFKQVLVQNHDEGLNKLKNKECDLVTFMQKTDAISKSFNLSNSHISFPLVLTTRLNESFISSLKSLNGKKIAYVEDTYKELLVKEYPNIQFVKVNSLKQGLQKVENEELFGLIEILPTVGFELQKNFSNSLKISKEIFNDLNFSMATSNDDSILIEIINKLIKSVSKEQKEQILNQWVSINYENSVDYQRIILISTILLLIIFIILFKNRQINKINDRMKKYIHLVDENILNSSTDLKGKITYVSKAFCKISGYTKEELIGKNQSIIRHQDTSSELYNNLWETIKRGNIWNGEIKNKKKNGAYYWVKATISPVFDNNKNIIGYTAITEDITDKKRIEEISITDELTGLYNRRYFNETFEREVSRAKRDNQPFALITFDIDSFKLYNDNYGHQAGDVVLQSIGNKLKSLCKRPSDFPFRIGGEEFAIIFTPYFKENAIDFADLITNEIRNLKIEHKYSLTNKYITISVGLYTAIGDKINNIKEIYYYTDLALYEAKRKGKNQYVIFDKSLIECEV